jgi:hypothetical protein
VYSTPKSQLQWTSVGTNKIEVRRAVGSAAIPAGVKLFVQLGTGTTVEIPSTGWVTLLASTTDTSQDQALTYTVTLDPVSSLRAAAAVIVNLEYRIGP